MLSSLRSFRCPDVTTNTKTNLRVSADLVVSGGAVSSPVVALWLRKAIADAAAAGDSAYLCGFFGDSTFKITRDGVDVATRVAAHTMTDGDSYAITFTQSCRSITCQLSGTSSETLSNTDSSVLTGTYQGFIGGVNGEDFIFVDNFIVG